MEQRETNVRGCSRPRIEPPPTMLFYYYSSGPPLCDFVHDFWLYDGYTGDHSRKRILPSGTFELVINLQDDALRIYDPAQIDQYRRLPI